MPAVQSARESARNALCKSRLAQIGIALESFHSFHGKFPGGAIRSTAGTMNLSTHVQILPHLDQQTIYDQFDHAESGSGLNKDPPESDVNGDLLMLDLPIFACPSDGLAGGKCSFRISAGTSPGMHESLPPSPSGALQGYRSLMGRADGTFVDGKSQTTAFSERLAGDRDAKHYTPWRDSAFAIFDPASSIITPDQAVALCERPVNPNPKHASFGGFTWALSGYSQTWYNHVLPPNASTPDCAAGGPGGLGAYTARSFHVGGVNTLFADGSVHFSANSIELPVWRALGTVNGHESVSID